MYGATRALRLPSKRHIRIPSLVRKFVPSQTNQFNTTNTNNKHTLWIRLMWTYTRLLCSSSCYIAGLAFYNALNSVLNNSTNNIFYMNNDNNTNTNDVHHPHRNKHTQHEMYINNLIIRWCISLLVLVSVIIFVHKVVQLSEKKFVYQVQKENNELIQRRLMQQHNINNNCTKQNVNNLVCDMCGFECNGHISSVDDTPISSPNKSPHNDHINNNDITASIQPAVLFNANSNRLNNSKQPINSDTLDTVAKRREYMAEWRSARRMVYRQKILFTYRLADMLSYYLVFVAVYSLQSTLQLTIPFDSLSYQWGYFICIGLSGYTITSYLTHTNRKYIDQLTQSLTCEQHEKLRVKQGIQRKLSSYITSSISYLLAYACWNSIQATLIHIAAKSTRSHVWFVWILSSCVMIMGTALLVLLNIRIHSQVLPDENTTGKYVIQNLFDFISDVCCRICCRNNHIQYENPLQPNPISISRLHVRVDILEGGVHTPSQQLGTEAMSYIAALSIGASVAAAIPAAPSDESTYIQVPTLHGLTIYAICISLVAASLTAVLEKLLSNQSDKHRLETKHAYKTLVGSDSDEQINQMSNHNDTNDTKSHHDKTHSHKHTNKSDQHATTTRSRGDERDYLDELTEDEYGDDDEDEEENALEEEEYKEEQRKLSGIDNNTIPSNSVNTALYISPRFKSHNSNNVLNTIITISSSNNINNQQSTDTNNNKKHNKKNVSISIDLQPIINNKSQLPPRSPHTATYNYMIQSTQINSKSTQLLPPSINCVPGSAPANATITRSATITTPLPPATDDIATDQSQLSQHTPLLMRNESSSSSISNNTSIDMPIMYNDIISESTHLTVQPKSTAEFEHRLLLGRTFIHEWYVALVGTCVQGLSLMCAYGWVGLLYFGVLPQTGLDINTTTTAWIFAAASFIAYAALTTISAKLAT